MTRWHLGIVALVLHALIGAAQAVPSARGTPTGVSGSVDACNWDRPGLHPFMGNVVGAVDRYTDIPADVRERLKARMARREYDDLVSIRRDSISGQNGHGYADAIREMHFGDGQVCQSVTRTAWTPAMEERGLVYCDSGNCILVPTVCRNVSRISRRGVSPEHAEAPPEGVEPVVPPAVALTGPFGDPGATPLGFDDGAPTFATPQPWGDDLFTAGAPGAGRPDQRGSSSTTAFGDGGAPAGVPVFGNGLVVPGRITGPIVGGAVLPDVVPLVPVAAVPEPQTWALMLGGLVALAAAARRRRAVSAAPAMAPGSAR